MNHIIISGANQGIGFFMTKQLLHAGHYVAVLDINIDNARTLKPDSRISCHVCDIRDSQAVQKAVSQVHQQWGVIDIAIHNACICPFSRIENTPIDTYKDVFDVNYFGAVNLTKAVMPLMKAAHQGKIIYMSSGVAIMGFQNLSAYAGSKNAIESLAKCLNIECGSTGIHFHIMHPPLTHTASSSPLPIPKEMMKNADNVGRSLAKNIGKKSFIICGGFFEKMQIRLIYMFSAFFGRLFSKLTYDSNGPKKCPDAP